MVVEGPCEGLQCACTYGEASVKRQAPRQPCMRPRLQKSYDFGSQTGKKRIRSTLAISRPQQLQARREARGSKESRVRRRHVAFADLGKQSRHPGERADGQACLPHHHPRKDLSPLAGKRPRRSGPLWRDHSRLGHGWNPRSFYLATVAAASGPGGRLVPDPRHGPGFRES